jgi:hypothetical protein
MYWWNGKLEKTGEYVIFAKSLARHYDAVVRETRKMHPYEVPLIAKFEVEVNEEYLKWMKTECFDDSSDSLKEIRRKLSSKTTSFKDIEKLNKLIE